MRPALLALALIVTPAAASVDPPTGAAGLFAERTALLAADTRCRLLAAPVRAALVAGAGQARAAALRDGWESARLDRVAVRAAENVKARDCADPMVKAAAASAEAGYAAWAKAFAMDFPGATRSWSARRAPDPAGWTLSQTLPDGGRFGLRENRWTFHAPWRGHAPAGARLVFRDAAKSPAAFDVPGLEGAAAPGAMTAALASSRRMERAPDAPPAIVFTFPPAAVAAMSALDPRESAFVELTDAAGGASRRIPIEVGDLAAARAFLAAR